MSGDDVRAEIFDAPGPKQVAPSWTQEAIGRALALEGRLDHVDPAYRRAIAVKLMTVRRLLDQPAPGWWHFRLRLMNWWSGDRIETTWAWLEQAEIDIVDHSDRKGVEYALVVARQHAERVLDKKNKHRVALEKLAKHWPRRAAELPACR